MSNTFIPKLLSVFVVLIMTLAVAIPVIETINTSGHTDPSIQVYGYTSLDAYTDTLKSEKGNISGLYASMRGDISGDAFIESVDGDYLAYPLGMALAIPDQLVGHGQFIGLGSSLSSLWLGTYTANTPSTLSADGITLTLTPYEENSYFATVGVTATASSGYVVVPYEPTAPIATYGTNSIHSLVLTDTVGDMTGTTFTPAAGGSWLMIPMHILRDSVKDYKLEVGDMFYAPDTNGDLAAFTASAAGVVSGTNAGVTITLTQDPSFFDSTVYLLTATVTDMDLPGVVVPLNMTITMPVPQSVRTVAAGTTSYCVDNNGALWVTGKNDMGQFGNGTSPGVQSNPYWLKVVPSGVTAVFATDNRGFYIDTDGALWATGKNSGAFGDGTTTNAKVWTKVVNSGVKSVSASSNFSFYVDDDGALWATGQNSNGQHGDGGGATKNTWTKVVNSGVKYAVAAPSTALAYYISTTGELYATGSNQYGQFGDGTTTNSTTWTKVVNSGVADAVIGGVTSYYVDTNGALYGAGRNNSGQLGTGTTSNTPVTNWTQLVSSGVISVKALTTAFYIDTSYKLYSTGANSSGQQGDGTTTNPQTSWHEAKANSPTFTYTNPTETETVSDLRGTVTDNVFTANANGTYLYIPIEDATTYSYYVAVGSTVYAPNTLGTALAPHTVPDTTGIDPAVTITLTLVSGYEDQIYEVTATTTDTDIVGWAIPYTVVYLSEDSEVSLTANYEGTYGYAFTPNESGTYMRVPLQVANEYEYFADMGSTYYYTGDDGTLQTDTVDTPIYCDEYTVMFDLVEYPTYVLLPDITGDLTGLECVVIPVEYGEGQQNVVHEAGSYTYEPLLGDMIQGEFVEDDHGAWVLLYPANLMESEVTYYLGTVHSYYFGGLSDLVQYTAPATPQEGLAITLTATETDDVSVLTVTEMDPDSVMLIPYKINYTVPGEPIKMLPFLDIIPLVLVILSIVVVAALIYDRKTGGL